MEALNTRARAAKATPQAPKIDALIAALDSKSTAKTPNSSALPRNATPRVARRHASSGGRAVRRPVNQTPALIVTGRQQVRNLKRPEPKLCQELLERYSPLVRKIAGGFQRKLPRNVLREDLIAAGMSGLWDAIRRHPEGPSESFEWYVRVRIRGAILDELRAQDWLPRRARAAAEAQANTDAYVPPPAVVRFDDVSEWEQNRCLSDFSSSETAVANKFTHETLAKAVDQLPTRERHIVSAHYFRGVKFKDLGLELGVSEPRISQLHSRAIQRLKSIMSAAA